MLVAFAAVAVVAFVALVAFQTSNSMSIDAQKRSSLPFTVAARAKIRRYGNVSW
ncbi:hypothetical protein D3C72_2502410 [compost metagenome]